MAAEYRPPRPSDETLRGLARLKLVAIVGPIAFLIALEVAVAFFIEDRISHRNVAAVELGITVPLAIGFSLIVFRTLERAQRSIIRQSGELADLNAVGQAVTGTTGLREAVTLGLERVIRATGAAAGEVVFEDDEASEGRIRIASGQPADLQDLARAVEPVTAGREPHGAVGAAPLVAPVPGGMIKRRAVVVPLVAQSRAVGSLRLLVPGGNGSVPAVSPALLGAMGNQLAVALKAGHLFENVLQRRRESRALFEIGLQIVSVQDARRILDRVVDQARQLLGADVSFLCLAPSTPGGECTVVQSPGAVERRFPDGSLPLTAVQRSDVADAAPSLPRACPVLHGAMVVNHLSAPLRMGDIAIGDLCVGSKGHREFAEHDRDLLAGLADMAAIAISNARLLEQQRYVAVLEERERLSRELHDSLAQVLGYLHLRSQKAVSALVREDRQAVEVELKEISTTAHDAYQDVREAILGLRETVSTEGGIVGALREYAQKFSRQSGIQTEVRAAGAERLSLSPEAEVQILRVIQEALTNVRKHSGGGTACIDIRREGAEMVFAVTDDGRGFDAAELGRTGEQFGLKTMRERTERLGAILEIDSSPGRGTQVAIRLATPVSEMP